MQKRHDVYLDLAAIALRNVLAHGYAALDHVRVYKAASTGAPALLSVIQHLLSEFPET